MKRKVAKIGPSTLMVSLPNKWVKKFNIKKGDEVDVEEDGDKLILNLGKLKEGKSKILNVHDLDVMLNRAVGACYKKGYDEVAIHFNSTEQLKSIYSVINTTWIGFEIIEQSKNKIVMKQVGEVIKDDLPNIINRVMLFLISTADEGIKAAEAGNEEYLKAVVMRDPTQNRYCDFCRRLLNKTELENSNALYYIVEQFERIGDFYRDLSKIIADNQIKVRKDLINLYRNINENLQHFYRLYNKFDLKGFESFGKNFKTNNRKIKEAMGKLNKKDAMVLSHLQMINEGIFDMNGALLIIHLEHI